MAFESGRFGRIRYSLNSEERGKEFIQDPINWDESDREYKRNELFRGIFSKISNNLEFTKDGFDYLVETYRTFGVEPDITLTKEAKNNKRPDERWEVIETGFLNLSGLGWNDQRRVARVKFDEVGFWQKINNRKGERYDLIPETSPDGIDLGPLPTRQMLANGRQIFLRSEYRPESSLDTYTITNQDLISAQGISYKPVPFVPFTNSDQDNLVYPVAIDTPLAETEPTPAGPSGDAIALNAFLLDSKTNKQNVKFTVNFTFTLQSLAGASIGDESIQVFFTTFDGGENYNFVSKVELLNIDDPINKQGQQFTISQEITQNVLIGESRALLIQITGDVGTVFVVKTLVLSNISGSLVIEEDSIFPASEHPVLLPHEKFERLITILTGRENAFYSEYFGRRDIGYDQDGEGAFIACASGFMVREFPNVINQGTPEEKRTQYKTSFRDLYQSYDSITPLAVMLEGSGVNLRVRVEPVEFIFQKFLALRIERNNQFLKITDLEINVDDKKIFSTIKIGSEKGGTDYEEAFGLDEFNGLSEFATIHSKVENEYSAVSKYRKDSYGHEFARRRRYPDRPEEDTRYDEDIFMLDLKPIDTRFTVRLWPDDFESAPTGIYSPETVFNLRLSPGNTIRNHSVIFGGSLINRPNDFINFTSSNSNSSLATKKAGQPQIVEDGRIKNSDLKRPLFLPEKYEFTVPFVEELIQTVEGVNENNIPNVNGYIQIETRNGFEALYIDTVKVSDDAKFTCRKAWL